MKRFLVLKRFVVAFIVMTAMLFPLAVFADVVVGNDFFYKNREKTEHLYRLLQVNGAFGVLSSKEKPGGAKIVDTYKNGDLVYIGHTYLHKGKYWGIPPISHMYSESGWLPMDELLMLYDSADFESEYQDVLYEYAGGFEPLLAAEEYYVWQWPGSDREKSYYEYMSLDASDIQAGPAYMDGEGREWLYVTLWGGSTYGGLSMGGATEGWVCLSDLGNAQIPSFKPAPAPVPWVNGEAPDWYGPNAPQQPSGAEGPAEGPGPIPANEPDLRFVIVLAAVCFAAAAAIIIIAKRNKKKMRAGQAQ